MTGKHNEAPWSTVDSSGRAFARLAARRGNFYFALGVLVLFGLAAVVALGFLGVQSLGLFSVRTAMMMVGASIAILAVAEIVSLTSLRRTMKLLGRHEAAIDLHESAHASGLERIESELREVSRLQRKWHDEQARLDGRQDRLIDNLTTSEYAHHAEVRDRIDAMSTTPHRNSGPPAAPFDPFERGQVHPVKDVEGIGERFAERLRAMGIHDTSQLWRTDAAFAAGRLGVAPRMVENWQRMAELMAVHGIGKQYAEVLVRTGIPSIRRLAEQNAEHLADRIRRLEAARDHRVQGNHVGSRTVEHWVDAAAGQLGFRKASAT